VPSTECHREKFFIDSMLSNEVRAEIFAEISYHIEKKKNEHRRKSMMPSRP
jgi:hypothetical protein